MPSEHVFSLELEARIHLLRGRCLLVVEDDYMLATELADLLQENGAKVLGPVACVEDALKLMGSAEEIDGALIDLELTDGRAYPIAEALRREGIPFAFVSGFDAWIIPKAYADAPYFEKPVDTDSFVPLLVRALWGDGSVRRAAPTQNPLAF